MSGWKVTYKELLSISVQQAFYENGICKKFVTEPQPDFLIVPTNECRQLMKRLDLVFKPIANQGGGIILAQTTTNTASENVLRFTAQSEDKLSFWMVLQNPELLNFNSLPATRDPNKIWYFSNAISDAGAPRNDLHLSIDGAGVDGANDLMIVSGQFYKYHHNTTLTPNDAFVKHLASGALIGAERISNQSGESVIFFDLSSIPSGKCRLIISGADIEFFYYIGVSAPISVFGVIELLLTPSLEPNYRTLEAENVLSTFRPFYTIQFNNRKTLWRYTIELQKNNPIYMAMQAMSAAERAVFINHFKIICENDAAITFTQSLFNDTVFEFRSDNVIPLKEKYISSSTNEGLRLVLKKNEGILGEAVVRDYLPLPSNGLVNASGNPAISDVFLTL